MKFKNTLSLLALTAISLTAISQNTVTDSTATVLGYWKKGDKVSLSVKTRKQKFKDDLSTSDNTSTYKVNISVVDESPDSYTLEWKTSDIKVAGMDADNPVVSKLAQMAEGLVMRYKTDAGGSFQELLNWEEVRK